MLKTYTLDSSKLSKQIRGIFLLYGITGVIALIAIFITQRVSDNPNPPWLVITVIPVLIVFVASRFIHQRKELWENYSLTLEEASLVQSQPDSPDTKIALASVTGIEETKDGLYLSSNQGNRIFGIPRQLKDEDYDELRLMLRNLVDKKDQSPPSFE